MTPCAYCGRELQKNQRKYHFNLCRCLYWYRIYEPEFSRPGRRPTVPGVWDYVRNAAIAFSGRRCEHCRNTAEEMAREIRDRMGGHPEWVIELAQSSHPFFEVHHKTPLCLGGYSIRDYLIVLCKCCRLEERRGIRRNGKLRMQHRQILSGIMGVIA